MTDGAASEQEITSLRSRFDRLSRANARISENLDFETTVQSVVDNAGSLTNSRYGILILVDHQGEITEFRASGVPAEETQRLRIAPGGAEFWRHLLQSSEPIRRNDLHQYTESLGLPRVQWPMEVSSPLSFISMPIALGGLRNGSLFLCEQQDGRAYTEDDDELLAIFGKQASVAIANARRYRDAQRARADLEALINTSPVGVLVLDAKSGELQSINREAKRIGGELLATEDSSVEQLLKIVTLRRADGLEVALSEFPLEQALSEHESVRAEEIVIESPTGQSVTALVNSTPISGEDGEVGSVVVTLQDMTPLKDLDRLRAEFLAMVSHELRSPLTSIKGSAATLLESAADLDPAELHQFHRLISEQADSMRKLIGELLDVARIESGSLSVRLEPATVASVIDEARTRFLSGGGRDRMHIELAPDLPPVMADKRRVVQVLINLLNNAAKYSAESSPIEIAAVRDGIHVAFSVTDEGQGIAPERLPRLFRKLSSAERGSSRHERDGSGLGLVICRGIVEAHGGRIWAESDGVGLGSRFTFTVPVIEQSVAPVESRVETAPARARRREAEQPRILAVDDDPQVLRYIRDALTRTGYTAIVTADPDEVPKLMEAHSPHLVLMDLMLPGTDGIELMKAILATNDVPIIFLSAYSQAEVVTRAYEMGASDYIVKPFTPTELAARIRSALVRRTAPEQAEPAEPYISGDLTINYLDREVTVGSEPVDLTATEYKLLSELSINAGRVLTHNALLKRIWGFGHSRDSRPLRTIVKNLRRKLRDEASNPSYIFTEHRVGYRLAKPTSVESEAE
ncbi:MAG: response regulator [Chloroflexi bacterium]|nr:response regulator [Chloroflexota bacterium]